MLPFRIKFHQLVDGVLGEMNSQFPWQIDFFGRVAVGLLCGLVVVSGGCGLSARVEVVEEAKGVVPF